MKGTDEPFLIFQWNFNGTLGGFRAPLRKGTFCNTNVKNKIILIKNTNICTGDSVPA